MRHFAAKQRASDARWDYTSGNSPVGYCCNARIEAVFKGEGLWVEGKHHVDGHATREEAEACYKAYLLDTRMFETKMADQLLRCEVCETFTAGIMRVGGYRMFVLCDEHRNRATLDTLLAVEESWES